MGGISVRGLEGAILGPILLCLLIVVSNVYTSVIAGGNSSIYNTSTSVDSSSVTNEAIGVPTKPSLKGLRSQSFMGMDSNRDDVTP